MFVHAFPHNEHFISFGHGKSNQPFVITFWQGEVDGGRETAIGAEVRE